MKIIIFLCMSINILFAQTVTITLPEVPSVPVALKVNTFIPFLGEKQKREYKTNEEILRESTAKKVVHFSNHVAPQMIEPKDDTKFNVKVGEVKNGRVSAYLHAPLKSVQKVILALEKSGFRVVKEYMVDKKAKITSIAFTNDALIKLASKENKGFASILRITIDKKDKLMSITNPLFILKAFMGDAYDDTVANNLLVSLRKTFKNLQDSNEFLKVRILKNYQFMRGLPKYDDMQVIAEDLTPEMLVKIKKHKNVVYELSLTNGSTLLGIKLNRRTSKFIKKIGYQNAGLLPYPVLIENGEAKILDPKYYIAIMYPMLKMSQFMTIATVPGAINKDADRVFR